MHRPFALASSPPMGGLPALAGCSAAAAGRLLLRAHRSVDPKSLAQDLNGRPRRILGFQTPEEVFSDLNFNEFLPVALQA